MPNFKERGANPSLDEQLKGGLISTAKTLASFGVDNAQIHQPGRVRFKSEDEIVRLEMEAFERYNSILGMFGENSQILTDAVFGPVRYHVGDGSTIFLQNDVALAVTELSGQNISDRKKVSDRECVLYEFATSSFLENSALTVDATETEAAVKECIQQFNSFLDEFISNNPELESAATLHQQFAEIIEGKSAQGLNVKVKGVLVSLLAGDQSLFTINRQLDRKLRYLMANRMFNKFDFYMSQKFTWFSPSEKTKNGLVFQPEMDEELEGILKDFEASDTKQLVQMYLSGELGLKYLDSQLHPKMDAVKLKESMLGVKDDSVPDYSVYEVEGESNEMVDELLEMEEAEPIVVPSLRKKNTLRKMRN